MTLGFTARAGAFVHAAARSSASMVLLSVIVCSAALSGCASRRGADLDATTRWVVTPSAIAFLTPGDSRSGLPAELELGGAHGRTALYLKFPSNFGAPRLPRAAFIALSRAAGIAGTDAVRLEAWRVTSAWEPNELVTWADKPRLAPPFARSELSYDESEDLRIDVSELVRFAARHPDLDFGIALIARGGPGRGLSVATGIAGGHAPRLEVYVR